MRVSKGKAIRWRRDDGAGSWRKPLGKLSCFLLVALRQHPLPQGKENQLGVRNSELYVSPSQSTHSQVQYILDDGRPPLASPPTPSHDTLTNGLYPKNQLDLLKKLSHSDADGSVLAVVAKRMLRRERGTPGDELEASGSRERLLPQTRIQVLRSEGKLFFIERSHASSDPF